jgi:cytochrome c oxidase subunit 1
MLLSFVIPAGGAAQSAGLPTRRSPTSREAGRRWWLVGMVLLITSSLLGAGQLHHDDHPAAREGTDVLPMTPSSCGPVRDRVSSLAGIPRRSRAAGVLQLMDRVAGTSFFLPSGLVVSGQALQVSGGGTRSSGSTCSGSWPTPRCTS